MSNRPAAESAVTSSPRESKGTCALTDAPLCKFAGLPAPTRLGEVTHTLSRWPYGTERFGACAVCGGHVSAMHSQVEFVATARSDASRARRAPEQCFYWRERSAHIGHRECLVDARKAT